MPSDYNSIRADNIREYGEGTRHLSFLGRLYTDRTHFIFELLQNAEDAGAAKILFELFEDRLEVKHDGRPFDECDVQGVCGVGKDTKAEDLTQIGKFGIGFKSVYAYTPAPEVHSGAEHFRIKHYVRPYKAATKMPGDSWTTLFVFAFDAPGLEPQRAMYEIAGRLRNLNARTLLFLRNIKEIEYKLPDETGGVYLREAVSRDQARQVTVIGQNNGQDEDESWLVFERPLSVPDGADMVWVEIGFKLETNSKDRTESIVRIKESPLVVYFPTEKSTRFGFLIQGPYRTTPSRDNIPKDDDWNTKLVEETSLLLVDALQILKKMGLLTVALLNALPIRMDDFSEDSMFYPIVEAVRNTLMDQELLPADGGMFVSARNAKLASAEWLRTLLRDEHLRQLFKTETPMKWISGEITEGAKHDLWKYILEELEVEEITPDSFARKIEGSFLEKQTDDWMIDFYTQLVGQKALWKKGHNSRWDRAGPLRAKQFIRLQDGSHVMPFRNDDSPNVYLPPENETEFAVVKREITKDEKALEFLKNLGLTEPDAVAEVIERIIPKYTQNHPHISDDEHMRDIQNILHASSTDSREKKERLVKKLKETPFVKAENPALNQIEYKVPGQLYLPHKELLLYFDGNEDIWFVWSEYDAYFNDLFKDLGVNDTIYVKRKKPEWNRHVVIANSHGRHKRGLNGFDPDIEVDGLEHALNHPAKEKSEFIWNKIALPNVEYISGIIETSSQKTYEDSKKQKQLSKKFGKLLVETRWLPDKQGNFHKPSELTLDDLPESFELNEKLADQLGMKKNEIKRIEEKMGGKFVPKEEYEEFKRWQEQKANIPVKDEKSTAPEIDTAKIDYNKNELEKSFNRPGETKLQDRITDDGIAKNPDRRREKSYNEHNKRLRSEPSPEERRKKERNVPYLKGRTNRYESIYPNYMVGSVRYATKRFLREMANHSLWRTTLFSEKLHDLLIHQPMLYVFVQITLPNGSMVLLRQKIS